MGNLVQQSEMELLKMAMLKHEETFREQVNDLHRLYRIQKQLMSGPTLSPELRPCRGQSRRHPRPRPPELNLVGTGTVLSPTSREREDELELTLAVGCGRQRKRREDTTFVSDRSGRSLTSPSSTNYGTGELFPVPYHQRAMAFDLREGMMAKQPPWLLKCLSLRMA